MKGAGTIDRPGMVRNWTRRQLALAVLLLAAFIATAAVVPVLISPADPKPAAAPAQPSPTPSAVPALDPSPSPTSTPTPSPVSPFLVRPAIKPRKVGDPPRKIYREFQSICAVARQTSKPPLPGIAPAGKTAQYLVFGSTSTTLAQPGHGPAGSTSCVSPGDRSSYWVPVLYQGKHAIRPDDFTVLYKSAVDDYTSVQPFPVGLRMIAGGSGASPATPPEGAVSWSCSGYDKPDLPGPATCPAGDRLTLRLSAPGCWDGRHLDVTGHRDQFAWPLAGRCPASHPIAIPALLVRIIYPLDGTGALRLSSGPGDEFGFGFVSGWQPSALAKLIRTCINAGRQCDVNGKGN